MILDERLFRRFGRLYPKGTYIFREGDASTEMYYILSGKALVLKRVGRVTKVLAEMGPGECFGEMATLISDRRTASVRVLEDSNIAVIQAETFRSLLRESEEVSLLMLKELAERLKQTNLALEETAQARFRLGIVLYLMEEWPLPPDREPISELAGAIGKDPEEIRSVLEGLAEQGILEMRDGSITEFKKERVRPLIRIG
ncbi:MAG: Crp/Fnr family transcriptional regulator [Deltaproteobacteria bacterium]|nr:Crp/Fnr family transcriptional regulator [Deltaproteobacteria bacterium]